MRLEPSVSRAGSSPPGVRFRAHSGLGEEAIELLRLAPRPSAELARRVLCLHDAASDLSVRLVAQLLDPYPEVRRDARGVWRLGDAPAEERWPLAALRFAVVDVETTGGMPSHGGRVVEISVFHVREGGIREALTSLVDPGVPVPPWISRLTGISNRMLSGAPRFDEISEPVRRSLEGRVFVAHNAAYDWRFVGAEMRRARSLLPTGPRLCTIRLARRVIPGLRSRGLGSLARYYGVEIEERHRARGDARATAAILLRLLADAERNGVTGWRELRRWMAGSPPREKRPC